MDVSSLNYSGKSKVLQYFGDMKYNSVALDTFAEILKVTNHTGL